MSAEYVVHEGQICRKVESFEPVDIAQLASKVDSDTQAVEAIKADLDALKAQVDVKTTELEDAESVLEDSKRDHAAATVLVAEPSDDESDANDAQADAASGAADDLVAQPAF